VAVETPLDGRTESSRRDRQPTHAKGEECSRCFLPGTRRLQQDVANLSAARLPAESSTSSAANPRQGVRAARSSAARRVIVMPSTTPRFKVVRGQGPAERVHLNGDTPRRSARSRRSAWKGTQARLVSPYEDPVRHRGPGAHPEWKSCRQTHPIPPFRAYRRGGLVPARGPSIQRMRPAIKVGGVEPVDADAIGAILIKAGRRVVDHVGLFADGFAVKTGRRRDVPPVAREP